MSGAGRIQSDTTDVGISEGGHFSPTTSVLTVDEMQTIIIGALRQQEET